MTRRWGHWFTLKRVDLMLRFLPFSFLFPFRFFRFFFFSFVSFLSLSPFPLWLLEPVEDFLWRRRAPEDHLSGCRSNVSVTSLCQKEKRFNKPFFFYLFWFDTQISWHRVLSRPCHPENVDRYPLCVVEGEQGPLLQAGNARAPRLDPLCGQQWQVQRGPQRRQWGRVRPWFLSDSPWPSLSLQSHTLFFCFVFVFVFVFLNFF